MKLTDIISIDKKFQASVNLEYDLNNMDKVAGYIPTEQSVAMIDRFLRGVYYPESLKRANILVGPYGRGKSHLLLVLSAILSMDVTAIDPKKARIALQQLAKKISRVNEQTGALVKSIIDNEIRLLPVIVNSNGVDISQSLILALRDALERARILDLLPSTHFDSAIGVLDMWEVSYPEAYKKFCFEIKQKKVSIVDFKTKLGQYDIEAYNLFCDIYPLVAAGTTFNPYGNTDVIKLYLSVNQELKNKTAFNGMFIIFDEFSKFVESNLDKSKMGNFKIIQDLAEITDREKDPQIHFTCVTHKALLDYSVSDSFKTVEGRFGSINFVSSSEQSYELIANAISKKPEFANFKDQFAVQFDAISNSSHRTGVFSDINEETFKNKLVYGCFPIAPITAYSLLRVSEKVGQNERTIFTFIAQNEKGTLVNFLKDHEGFDLMTIDYVFDYFQDLFKKSLFNESVHSMWAKANSALYQIEDLDAKRIIKAISIIGIISDEKLLPISTHLRAALNFDDERFKNAIKKLIDLKIVAQRNSSEYVLLTANGVDVQNNVNDFVQTKALKINRCELLNRLINRFVLPRQYNDEYCMIRYFKTKFIEANEFMSFSSWTQITNNEKADGFIFNILLDAGVSKEMIFDHLSEFSLDPQLIVCIPDMEDSFDDETLKQLYAVQEIKKQDAAKADKHYFEELEVFEEDAKKRLIRYIEQLYGVESRYSHLYNCNGEIADIRKQVSLNRALSKICFEKYNLTPRINNEMANKNVITAPIRKARNLIIDHIFANANEAIIPEIQGLGPEVSVFGSMFIATGLNRSTTVDDQGLSAALQVIDNFIQSSEDHRQSFTQLYKTLLSAPFGIRKGIIPMLVAYCLRHYKENLVIYYGNNEVELCADILDALNEVSGEKYQLLLESGTTAKDKVVDQLLDLFGAYSNAQSKSINKVYNVVKCMQNWMRSLPEYTKKCKGVYTTKGFDLLNENEFFFRKELLKFEINSREFLLHNLFSEIFNSEEDKAFEWIKTTKDKFDNQIEYAKEYLAKQTRDLFATKYNGSLSSAIITWKTTLSENTIQHLFDATTNQVLGYIVSVNNYDDNKVLLELTKTITNVNLVDWNDEAVTKYLSTLSEIISTIEKYEKHADATPSENGIDVTVNGTKITKTFATTSTSAMGQALKNNLESSMDEFADSVTPEEKLNILLELIKDLIN